MQSDDEPTDTRVTSSSTDRSVGSPHRARARKLAIWRHFNISPDATSAICKYCHSPVQRKDSNTHAMRSHVLHNHPEKLAAETDVIVDNTIVPALKSDSKAVELLIYHAVHVIAEKCRPLHLFESPHLRQMFSVIRPGSENFLPTRSQLSATLIPRAAAAVKTELAALFGPNAQADILESFHLMDGRMMRMMRL